MEMLINVGIIIGILIIVIFSIKILMTILAGILLVWAKCSEIFYDRIIEKKSKKKDEENKEKAMRIIEVFEDYLTKYNVKIPNDNKEESEDEEYSGIYGTEYYELEDNIIEILDK